MCPIGSDHLLIPVIAILWNSCQILNVLIITVYIHQTIALLVTITGAEYIHKGPWQEASYIHSQLNSSVNCLKMLRPVVDTVIIMYLSVLQYVSCSQTILCDDHWNLIALINITQKVLHTRWINSPIPVICIRIRIQIRKD
mgnify:FL=1